MSIRKGASVASPEYRLVVEHGIYKLESVVASSASTEQVGRSQCWPRSSDQCNANYQKIVPETQHSRGSLKCLQGFGKRSEGASSAEQGATEPEETHLLVASNLVVRQYCMTSSDEIESEDCLPRLHGQQKPGGGASATPRQSATERHAGKNSMLPPTSIEPQYVADLIVRNNVHELHEIEIEGRRRSAFAPPRLAFYDGSLHVKVIFSRLGLMMFDGRLKISARVRDLKGHLPDPPPGKQLVSTLTCRGAPLNDDDLLREMCSGVAQILEVAMSYTHPGCTEEHYQEDGSGCNIHNCKVSWSTGCCNMCHQSKCRARRERRNKPKDPDVPHEHAAFAASASLGTHSETTS
eukprot:TRINITY_DN7157_c0_g1_i3.p1 TRINITY_DN7157_c0_g1~~TRINITY_DN7157_c0_g1_i3.p1  ORF type:complete len:351 (-),score=32.88 TRINITY_DN7157_c0_g1_i3:381-1433(-)